MHQQSMFGGRVALVTGAGSGIGKACALHLAQSGAQVACLSRTESQLEEVVNQIKSIGGQGMVVLADVSQPDQMKNAVQRIEEQWGRLDIVVANAGINGVWASLEDISPEDWDHTLAVNLKGTFLTVKYALPLLKRQGGAIVVVSSVNGNSVFRNTGATAYSCSKAGQVAFTKMAAVELAPHKIRINVVCPGWFKTEIGENWTPRNLDKIRWPMNYPQGFIPLTGKQPADIEQAAPLISFLASDKAAHITGTEIYLDGGESLVQG